jgi:N-acyl-D-aspartate/D-glutamate deacylase
VVGIWCSFHFTNYFNFSLDDAYDMLTHPATVFGLNVRLRLFETVFDLPVGVRRLTQRADGYVATVVAGQTTIRNDEATGAEHGRLIRGEQFAPV